MLIGLKIQITCHIRRQGRGGAYLRGCQGGQSTGYCSSKRFRDGGYCYLGPLSHYNADTIVLGACGGSCACSTCHVIVESDEMYDKMDEPDDDENDMLDLAFGLTETSRLGCQVKMNKELDGLRVKLPSMTRNLQASDFSGAKKA